MIDGLNPRDFIHEFAEIEAVVVRLQQTFKANTLRALVYRQSGKSESGPRLQTALNQTLQFMRPVGSRQLDCWGRRQID